LALGAGDFVPAQDGEARGQPAGEMNPHRGVAPDQGLILPTAVPAALRTPRSGSLSLSSRTVGRAVAALGPKAGRAARTASRVGIQGSRRAAIRAARASSAAGVPGAIRPRASAAAPPARVGALLVPVSFKSPIRAGTAGT